MRSLLKYWNLVFVTAQICQIYIYSGDPALNKCSAGLWGWKCVLVAKELVLFRRRIAWKHVEKLAVVQNFEATTTCYAMKEDVSHLFLRWSTNNGTNYYTKFCCLQSLKYANGVELFHIHLLCQLIMCWEETSLLHHALRNFPGLLIACLWTDSIKADSSIKLFIAVNVYVLPMADNSKKTFSSLLQGQRYCLFHGHLHKQWRQYRYQTDSWLMHHHSTLQYCSKKSDSFQQWLRKTTILS